MANYLIEYQLINKFQTYDLTPLTIIGIKKYSYEIQDVVFMVKEYGIIKPGNNIMLPTLAMKLSDISFQYCSDRTVCRDKNVIKEYLSGFMDSQL
jgi:hypothetical protein